jgi:hypothetical protein
MSNVVIGRPRTTVSSVSLPDQSGGGPARDEEGILVFLPQAQLTLQTLKHTKRVHMTSLQMFPAVRLRRMSSIFYFWNDKAIYQCDGCGTASRTGPRLPRIALRVGSDDE